MGFPNEQKGKSRDTLIVSREEFKQRLTDCFSNGENLAELFEKEEYEQFEIAVEAWNDYNKELLKVSFNNDDNEYLASYKEAGRKFFRTSYLSDEAKWKDRFKRFEAKMLNLHSLLNKLDLIPCELKVNTSSARVSSPSDSSKVFIVHGHDDLAKTMVARFIEKIGLKPIILHEQANQGMTIIEKIEANADVGYGIVLYTPCDYGGRHGTEQRNRARQNVVFEHGYLIGRIGRSNVSALVKGEIETPNDISGVVYLRMDADWQSKIIKELKRCGYNPNLSGYFD